MDRYYFWIVFLDFFFKKRIFLLNFKILNNDENVDIEIMIMYVYKKLIYSEFFFLFLDSFIIILIVEWEFLFLGRIFFCNWEILDLFFSV